jgi:hypothetical protein
MFLPGYKRIGKRTNYSIVYDIRKRRDPPMIVYPYERIPAEIARNTTPDWVIGNSKSGWMTRQCFHCDVCNTFLPLHKEKNVKLPVLYLVDGHRSHLTFNVSKFCAENGIILFALYPNTTHILQPADVALFKPRKILFITY